MAKRNRTEVRTGGARDREVATASEQPMDPKKAAKKEANVAKRARKKEALKKVLAFVKSNTEDAEALAAVQLLTPGQRFGGVRAVKSDVIVEAFMANDEIDEDMIWNEYKLGRAEMRKICVNLIKKKAPADRLWISFDPDSGVYTLDGSGESAPDEWTGYTPVDMDDMEI